MRKLFLPAGQALGIALGERAFEIALARKIAAGEAETSWFERHGSTPITEIPAPLADRVPGNWSRSGLQVIESNPFIRLLERPEYKRRWGRRLVGCENCSGHSGLVARSTRRQDPVVHRAGHPR